jgi:hypothetical protein
MSYVQVPRDRFVAALELAGFSTDPDQRGELAFIRQHHLDPTMYVKIFTSLPLDAGDVRAKGTDAIRVVLIFKNPRTGRSGGLFKTTRVHRTGTAAGVIERTLERAREAYAEGNRRVKGTRIRMEIQ